MNDLKQSLIGTIKELHAQLALHEYRDESYQSLSSILYHAGCVVDELIRLTKEK